MARAHGSYPWCREFESPFRYFAWGLSSAGRASALQAEGHRFEPCRPHPLTKYGEIAQLARARGSYPRCRGFESPSRYEEKAICESRLLFYCVVKIHSWW